MFYLPIRVSAVFAGISLSSTIVIGAAVTLAAITGYKRSKNKDKDHDLENIVIEVPEIKEERQSRNAILLEWLTEMAEQGKLDEVFTKNKKRELEPEIFGD